MFDHLNYRRNYLKQRQYFKLIADLKVMIESSQAEAKDLVQERDLLTCIGCGAIEKNDVHSGSGKASRQARILPPGSFIIIEAKQKKIYPSNKSLRFNVYTYICPICGLYQNGLIRSKSA